MIEFKLVDGVLYKRVYAKYVRRDGRRVYPKRAKAFCFWVKA